MAKEDNDKQQSSPHEQLVNVMSDKFYGGEKKDQIRKKILSDKSAFDRALKEAHQTYYNEEDFSEFKTKYTKKFGDPFQEEADTSKKKEGQAGKEIPSGQDSGKGGTLSVTPSPGPTQPGGQEEQESVEGPSEQAFEAYYSNKQGKAPPWMYSNPSEEMWKDFEKEADYSNIQEGDATTTTRSQQQIGPYNEAYDIEQRQDIIDLGGGYTMASPNLPGEEETKKRQKIQKQIEREEKQQKKYEAFKEAQKSQPEDEEDGEAPSKQEENVPDLSLEEAYQQYAQVPVDEYQGQEVPDDYKKVLQREFDNTIKDYKKYLKQENPDEFKELKDKGVFRSAYKSLTSVPYEQPLDQEVSQEQLSDKERELFRNASKTKIDAYLGELKQAKNEQNPQRVKQVQKELQDTFRLQKEFIKLYPEWAKEEYDKKVQQKEVDEWYNNMDPVERTLTSTGFNFMKGLSGMAKGIAQLPATLSDDEAVQKLGEEAGETVDNWSNYLFPTRSKVKEGRIFEEDEEGEYKVNTDLIIPKISKVSGEMVSLLYGAGKFGSMARAAGLTEKSAYAAGLMGSSFVHTHDDYYEQAINNGLSRDDAGRFSIGASLLTGALENISPQMHVFGPSFRKAVSNEFASKVVQKGSKKAWKEALNFGLKETGLENVQEFTQLAGDKFSGYLANKIYDTDEFNTDFNLEEFVNTSILTTGATASVTAPSVIGHKNAVHSEATYLASEKVDQSINDIQKAMQEGMIDQDKGQEAIDEVKMLSEKLKTLPKKLNNQERYKIAQLVQTRTPLVERSNNPVTEDMVRKQDEERIKEINKAIETTIENATKGRKKPESDQQEYRGTDGELQGGRQDRGEQTPQQEESPEAGGSYRLRQGEQIQEQQAQEEPVGPETVPEGEVLPEGQQEQPQQKPEEVDEQTALKDKLDSFNQLKKSERSPKEANQIKAEAQEMGFEVEQTGGSKGEIKVPKLKRKTGTDTSEDPNFQPLEQRSKKAQDVIQKGIDSADAALERGETPDIQGIENPETGEKLRLGKDKLKRAVKEVRQGKNTKRANRLMNILDPQQNEGKVIVNQGSGLMTQKMEVPVEELTDMDAGQPEPVVSDKDIDEVVTQSDNIQQAIENYTDDQGNINFDKLKNDLDSFTPELLELSNEQEDALRKYISKYGEQEQTAQESPEAVQETSEPSEEGTGRKRTGQPRPEGTQSVNEQLEGIGETRGQVIRMSRPEFVSKHEDNFNSREEASDFFDTVINESMKSRTPEVANAAKKQKRKHYSGGKALNTLVDKISRAFPNIDVVTDPNKMPDAVRGTAGAFMGGKVYVNPEYATTDTPLHEFAHVWTAIARDQDPNLINRVRDEIEQSQYYDNVSKEYPELTNNQKVEEAFVRAVSDSGVRRLERNVLQKAADKVWDLVRKALKKIGLDPGTNFSSLTFDKLSDKVARELLSETPLTENSSVQLRALTNAEDNSGIQISNSILTDEGNTWIQRNLAPKWNEFLKTRRGLTQKLRDDIEGFGNSLNAATSEIHQAHNHLFNEVKKYRKEQGDEAAQDVTASIGSVFAGEKVVTDLPRRFQQPMKDLMDIRDRYTKMLKDNLKLRGDVIAVYNENLEFYLTENFNKKEEIESVEQELMDKHKREINELYKTSDEELPQRIAEIHQRYDNASRQLQETKLQELRGKRKQLEVMKSDQQSQTSKLMARLKEAEGRLERIQRGGEFKFTEPEVEQSQQIKKAIKEEQKKINDVLEQPQDYTAKQLEIAEQIDEINETIDATLSDQVGGNDMEFAERLLNRTQQNEIRLQKKQYDLQKVDFINYERSEKGFNLTFHHRDGHSHRVEDVSPDDIAMMLGDKAIRDMDFQGTGRKDMLTPTILTNNTVYERIKKNDGEYVHRSYMKHDFKDFADNLRKYITKDVYDKAYNHIKEKYEDRRIKTIRKEQTGDGTEVYSFSNIFGTESLKSYNIEDIDGFLRDMGVTEKDINAFKKTPYQEDFALSAPISPAKKHGIAFPMGNSQVESIIAEITESGNMDNAVGSKKISEGQKINDKILTPRKNIEPEIRDLMGQYTDPRINIEKTLVNMATKAEKDRFFKKFLDEGRGSIFPDQPNKRTKHHTKKIPKERGGPLGEFYTTPEVYNFLFEQTTSPGALERFFIAFSGIVKANFTVYRGASQTRNAWGAMMNLGATSFDPRRFGKLNEALKIASQNFEKGDKWAAYLSTPVAVGALFNRKNFGNKGDQYFRDMYREVAEQGLFEGDIESAQVTQMSKMWANSGSGVINKGKEAISKATEAPAKVYQLSDQVPKVAQYIIEKEDYMNAGFSEEEAKRIAGNIVKNTQPHYTRAPKIFKALSKFPLAGSFVMFRAEMYRTRANLFEQARKEINSGNEVLRKKGKLRMAGLATSSLVSMGAHVASKMMAGVGDEEDEAFRKLMPDYSDNNAFVYLDGDMTAPEYLDLTFIDPNSGFTNATLAAVRQGLSPYERVKEVSDELVGEFMSPEIAIRNISQIIYNEDNYGRPIYYKTDTWQQETLKKLQHGAKVFVPGELRDMYTIVQSLAQPDQGGYNLSFTQEVMNRFLGIKLKERDPQRNAEYRLKDYAELMYGARNIYDKGSGINPLGMRIAGYDPKTPEAKKAAKERIDEYFKEMQEVRDAAIDLGYSKEHLHQKVIPDIYRFPDYMNDALWRGYMVESDYGLDD